MNFLISNGHGGAARYTFGKVWAEAEIVRRRRNQEEAARAALDHTVHSAVHGGKKGAALLKETLKGLQDGGST